MKLYSVDYPADMWGDHEEYSVLKMAKSAGAAKYDEWLEASDCWDISFIDFCKVVKVRKVSQPKPLPGSAPFDRPERIERINDLIKEIGNRGRRFLYSQRHDRYAAFHWANDRLWYTDDYTGEPILMHKGEETRRKDSSFSHGGTLWGLIHDFRDYIFGDDDSNHNNGYGGLYSPHWGYPEEDMDAIRNTAVELGYLKKSDLLAVMGI